ncbi:MAG: hypothetical protein K2J30_06135, partial [Clostridia bacterium]|nr:hypothetical protein [Clostridia bacterium]
LTVTVSSTVSGGTWSAIDFIVSPMKNGEADPAICNYLSSPNHTTNMTSYTDNSADYFKVDPNVDVPGVRISLAWKSGNEISVSTSCVFVFDIVVAEGAPGGSSIVFGMEERDTFSVSYNDLDYDVTAEDEEFACNTVTVTIDAPSNDTGITSLNVGSGTATNPITTVAETMQWENPASTLNNFRVKPTLSDSNATYQVCVTNGTAENGTFPADYKTGAIKSGTESGNLNLMLNNNTNTTGIAKVFIRVVAADKTTTQVYCLTVKSKYAALAATTTIATQRPGGAVTVPKDGLEGGPISATKTKYNVFVPSDVTDSSGVQFVPKIPGGYGILEDIAVVGTGCTAATSVKGGATLLVTGIKNNATLTLTLTAASGATVDYTFTFKVVNIDTSIKTFTMTGEVDHAVYNSDSTKASADYYFALPSASGFKGTFNIELAQSTSTVTVGGKAYDSKASYGANNYSVVVTAEAGNTKTYSVTVENKFDAAKFEE